MYSVVIAFGFASLMLCIGIILRGKVGLFQKTLMPVSVIGGVIGFIFVNLFVTDGNIFQLHTNDFSNIVDVFFTLSFISIGLTGTKKKKNNQETGGSKSNTPLKGALGMSLVWCILYALTPIIGAGITSVLGKPVHMNPIYGILIPFAFCQGPGQASTYGRIFENVYGFANAEMVSLTFAIIGFLAAFLIGVPLAKLGIQKGLAKNKSKINASVERGYLVPEEQRENIGKSTTHSASIESVAAHFAIIGVCYLLTLVLSRMIYYVPVLGSTFSAMYFFWGMVAAYIVKAVMKKFHVDYLLNNTFLTRITGFLSDYLVVCAFMAIKLSVIGNWLLPILVVGVVGTIATVLVCLFFSARFGSDHDFERFLALYGTSTGTTPSGISLLRMVDSKQQTSTGVELGLMNMGMLFSTPTMIFITFAGLQTLPLPLACIGMAATILLFMILLKVFRVWKKPTFSLRTGHIKQDWEDDSDIPFLQGILHNTISEDKLTQALDGSIK